MLVRGSQLRCPVPLPHFPGLWHDKAEPYHALHRRLFAAMPPHRRVPRAERPQDDGRYFANVLSPGEVPGEALAAGAGGSEADADERGAEAGAEASVRAMSTADGGDVGERSESNSWENTSRRSSIPSPRPSVYSTLCTEVGVEASTSGSFLGSTTEAFHPGTLEASDFRRKVQVLPLRVPFRDFAAYYPEIRDSPLALVLSASDATSDRNVFSGDLMQVGACACTSHENMHMLEHSARTASQLWSSPHPFSLVPAPVPDSAAQLCRPTLPPRPGRHAPSLQRPIPRRRSCSTSGSATPSASSFGSLSSTSTTLPPPPSSLSDMRTSSTA